MWKGPDFTCARMLSTQETPQLYRSLKNVLAPVKNCRNSTNSTIEHMRCCVLDLGLVNRYTIRMTRVALQSVTVWCCCMWSIGHWPPEAHFNVPACFCECSHCFVAAALAAVFVSEYSICKDTCCCNGILCSPLQCTAKTCIAVIGFGAHETGCTVGQACGQILLCLMATCWRRYKEAGTSQQSKQAL